MTPQERELAEGVRALRTTLNESQQQFSNRLGISISTIARYELQNPPQGNMLLRLAEIAREFGREDLATLFQTTYDHSIEWRSPVAEAIRTLRTTTNETQQEFAQRAGLSVVSVARYETNAVPSKAVLGRLAQLARDAGRHDLEEIFEEEQAAEWEPNALGAFGKGGSHEASEVLARISDTRLKKIRKHLARGFPRESDLSYMCAVAWLLDNSSHREELENFFVDEISRAISERGFTFTKPELRMLGQLGRKAVAKKVQDVPLSETTKKLRQHISMSRREFAIVLNTKPRSVEDFETGKSEPGIDVLERMLWIARKSIHAAPEIDVSLSIALTRAIERERAAQSDSTSANSEQRADLQKGQVH